jgi:ribonuclease HI
METQKWNIEFNWIKAHVGQNGNYLADQLAKEGTTSRNINVCYKRIPKSTALREPNDLNVTEW